MKDRAFVYWNTKEDDVVIAIAENRGKALEAISQFYEDFKEEDVLTQFVLELKTNTGIRIPMEGKRKW